MVLKTRRREKDLGPKLPHSLLKLFAVAALLLVPWTILTAGLLPTKHLDQNWDVVWSGFDIGLLISLAATAYFGWRRSVWVVGAASSAGTFLLVDAWFDCVTAKDGLENITSFSTAMLFELPLALLAFWIAYHAGKYFFNKG